MVTKIKTTKIIGRYVGPCEGDDMVCLDHAPQEWWIVQEITNKDFPDGFICDYCGGVVK